MLGVETAGTGWQMSGTFPGRVIGQNKYYVAGSFLCIYRVVREKVVVYVLKGCVDHYCKQRRLGCLLGRTLKL